MDINFPLILVLLVLGSGLIILLDRFWLAERRRQAIMLQKHEGDILGSKKKEKMPLLIEYSRSFFPIFLVVLILRSFLFEPFRIPSGSLEPTLLVGDFVVVNKYKYGLRLPVVHSKILSIGEPKKGDIAVFRWPVDPTQDYIKRIIGTPGDRIQYKDKVLYINGKKVPQIFDSYTTGHDAQGRYWRIERRRETINGIDHFVHVRPDFPAKDFDVTVPAGHYFAMGDNRDDSADSRRWGFVPEQNLLGKAFGIWMSWNYYNNSVRWSRIGTGI